MDCSVSAWLKTMNHQVKKIEAIYYKLASNLDMPESEFWILYTLSEAKGDCFQQEISDELSVSKQTIGSAIQNLVRKGYLFLEPSPISARRKNIRMTEKGKRFVAESIAPLQEAERRAFLRMDALAQSQYVALSQEYAANLQEEIEGCFAVP